MNGIDKVLKLVEAGFSKEDILKAARHMTSSTPAPASSTPAQESSTPAPAPSAPEWAQRLTEKLVQLEKHIQMSNINYGTNPPPKVDGVDDILSQWALGGTRKEEE